MSDQFFFIGGKIQSISVAAVTTSVNTSQITIPANTIAGDVIVLYDRPASSGTPSGSPPAGFTSISNIVTGNYRMIFSYKIADGSDASRTVTGALGSIFTQKRMIVLRPNRPARSVVLGNVDAGLSQGSQSRTALAGGQKAPLAVIATYHMNTTSNVSRGMSPAKDGEEGSNNPALCWIAWKLFNPPNVPVNVTASLPADTSSQGVQITYIIPSLT